MLDLNLPRLDGIAILKDVRSREAQLPILILTARGRVEDRVQCLDSGAHDYLVKPFSFSELSARIRALLRRSRLPSDRTLRRAVIWNAPAMPTLSGPPTFRGSSEIENT